MNQTLLSAAIAEMSVLRYTPAGLPALDLRLSHESELQMDGARRNIRLQLKALAVGVQAERLAAMPLGSLCRFEGFLGSPRQGSQVVLHIQHFQPESFSGGPHGHIQEI